MMNDNYNKILKEKLSNESFAFDPNAWDKMEQMLDDKPKRRPIFWWWMAGISSVALLGFGAYAFVNFNNNTTIAHINSSKNDFATNSSNSNIKTVSNKETNTDNSILNNESTTISGENSQVPQSNKNYSSNNSNNAVNNNVLKTNNLAANSNSDNTSINKAFVSNNSQNLFIENKNDAKATDLTFLKAEKLENELFKNLYLDKLPTEEYFETKKEKNTAKNVAFELGIANFLGATGVGKQTDLKGENYNVLQNELSYSIGLTTDILLKNKWAISTGLMYGKTNFKIFQPVNYSVLLNSYQSTSQLLQIPLGIKYYAFAKNNFRLYANVGIINNIQIREKLVFDFGFSSKPNSSIELSLNGPSNSNNEDYSGADRQNTKLDKEVADFFSVNKSNNYYMQIYTGIGAEYSIKKKFAFFVEPRFHSDLSKIGYQEKRAFQLGVSSGMKWKF